MSVIPGIRWRGVWFRWRTVGTSGGRKRVRHLESTADVREAKAARQSAYMARASINRLAKDVGWIRESWTQNSKKKTAACGRALKPPSTALQRCAQFEPL